MKILLINDSCGSFGGAEKIVLMTKKMLQQHGHEVFLFRFSEVYQKNIINNYIYKEWNNKFIRGSLKALINPKLIITLRKIIRIIKPDIIHIHKNDKYPLSVLLALPNNIPVIQTAHDFGFVYPDSWGVNKITGAKSPIKLSIKHLAKGFLPPGKFMAFLPRFLLVPCLQKNKIKLFISPSKILANKMRQVGFSNVIQIPNCVDIPLKQRGTNANYSCLAGLSTLAKQKGLDILIKAFSQVVNRIPQARLIIIGEGPEKNNLLDLSKRLNLDKVISFKNFIPANKVGVYYQQCRIYILPSICMENSPLTILEAMAYDKPVIASKVGGISELLINNQTGLLFEPRNQAELSAKIIQLLLNPKKTKEMGLAAKNIYFRYHQPKQYYEKLIRLFSQVRNFSKKG